MSHSVSFSKRVRRSLLAFSTGIGAVLVSQVGLGSGFANATVIDVRDSSFSSSATAALPSGTPLNALAPAPGGKWLVATDGGMVRLNADGTKDTSYLGNYDVQGSNNNRYVTAMDVDSQGGAIISSGFWMGGIGRRLPDGSVDSNFAVDLINNGPYLSNHPRFIKVLDGGDILLAGNFDATNAFGAASLLKLTSTGDNVASFNTNVGDYLLGVSGTDSPPWVYDIEIDWQGRIIMAIQPFTQGLGALVRFNADGTPDTAFNQSLGAWLSDDNSPSNAIGKDVAVLPDGGYLVAAEVSGSSPFRANVLSPGHPWVFDCWDVSLFRVTDSGTSAISFNGTYDTNGVCGSGTRTVVGGTFSVEYGFPDLNAYTGEAADVGVNTGNYTPSSISSVDVDPLGNILVGGKFSRVTCCQAESGLVRLSSTGGFINMVNSGTSNWTGWDPGSGSSKGTFVSSLSPSGDTIVAYTTFIGGAIRKYSGNVTPPPTVSAVSPTSGSTAGGTAITITGTNLGNASTVTVGSAACTNVVVVSATSITCTTPAGTAGTASVVVTSGGQSNAANTLFTYNAPSTTTTAPVTTAPVTTAPVTTAPVTTTPAITTAPSGPVNVTSSNQATLTRAPGAATAVVNGQPVTVAVETPADLPAARVDPEDRSPAQVQALQAAADDLVSQLNQAAGGSSGLAVQDTPTGAAITGLLDKPVAVENTVLVEAGNKSTLFAALNQDGSVTEVQPGAVIEVLGNGQVGVVASGLTPGEAVEFVIMSTPTLLGTYTVTSNGTIKAQASLPAGVGLGDHTLVVASPTVQASLGLKVSATPATLPATGVSNGSNTLQIALWLIVGGLMVAYLRRRRLMLN